MKYYEVHTKEPKSLVFAQGQRLKLEVNLMDIYADADDNGKAVYVFHVGGETNEDINEFSEKINIIKKVPRTGKLQLDHIVSGTSSFNVSTILKYTDWVWNKMIHRYKNECILV